MAPNNCSFVRVACLLLLTSCSPPVKSRAVSTPPPPPQNSPVTLGYELQEENITFSSTGRVQRPTWTAPKEGEDTVTLYSSGSGAQFTNYITSDGKVYIKALQLSLSEDERAAYADVFLPEQAEAVSSFATSAAAPTTGTTSIHIQQETSCDGCFASSPARVAVTSTSTYPFDAIGQLLGELTPGATLETGCTGAVIGPSHVLTAAHCVYDLTTKAYLSTLNFSPGQNGASSTPYGTNAWKGVRVLQGFINQAPSYTASAADYDFALITLKTPVASGVGRFGLQYGFGDESVSLTTAGYPADKTAFTMWQTTCANTKFHYPGSSQAGDACGSSECANVVQHYCDSTHGQSGSPMWDSSTKIRAILTGSATETTNGVQTVSNWGVQINNFTYSTLLAWYQEDTGTVLGPPAQAPPSPPPSAEAQVQKNVVNTLKNIYHALWFKIAVIAIGSLLILSIVVSLVRCCCCMRPKV